MKKVRKGEEPLEEIISIKDYALKVCPLSGNKKENGITSKSKNEKKEEDLFERRDNKTWNPVTKEYDHGGTQESQKKKKRSWWRWPKKFKFKQ